MRILILLIPALLLAQDEAEAKPKKLKPEQQVVILKAMSERLLAEREYFRVLAEAPKALEAAQRAQGVYAELVKKVAAQFPGCKITEAIELDCSPQPEPKK